MFATAVTKASLLAKAVTKALLLARAVPKVESTANDESWFAYSIVVDEGIALAPTVVWVEGSTMLVKPVQPANADAPILVTLLGIVMLVRPVQFWNA